ncbi:MAG: Aryl-alcohol dehydrogenase [Marmoricola sp.]|jgi:aryl-alcohol dehydrogenase|nr:Aryl-alcohol dehydrogenase [Marmoricola sp.]
MTPGRTVVGLTLGDSETQTLVPALVERVISGMPMGKLVREHDSADIQDVVGDVASGATIEPVLRF